MRRLACVLIVLGLGCGDNGGTGGTGGIIVPDGGGGTGGTGGTAGMPDAGPAVGTRLSATGGSLVLVNKAQDHAAWLDLSSTTGKAHVVPLDMGADPTPINFSFVDLVTTGSIGWVNNTLIINHGLDTSNGVGKFAVWTTGMADALDITTSLNGLNANARPIASVSPDGTMVGFTVAGTAATTADVKMQTVATGSTPTTLASGLPADPNTCGNPLGQWAAWNNTTNTGTFVMLACDVGGTTVLLKKIAITAGTPVSTTISATGDSVVAFQLSIDPTTHQVDGKYAAYVSGGTTNSVKVVNLTTGQLVPGATDTTLAVSSTSPFPIGIMQGNEVYYLGGGTGATHALKKFVIPTAGNATITTVTAAAADWAGSSFDGNSFAPDASRVVYYTMIAAAGSFTFGSMALVSTNGTGTPLTLNTDNKGYPGDNVFSKMGTYVWWYDNVDTTTTGIGTIHSRKADGSDQPQTVGPGGFFIRQTETDNIAVVMANSHVSSNYVVGDLNRTDVSTNMSTKLTDQITYMDMVYPSGQPAKVVYSRRDGIYITPLNP